MNEQEREAEGSLTSGGLPPLALRHPSSNPHAATNTLLRHRLPLEPPHPRPLGRLRARKRVDRSPCHVALLLSRGCRLPLQNKSSSGTRPTPGPHNPGPFPPSPAVGSGWNTRAGPREPSTLCDLGQVKPLL